MIIVPENNNGGFARSSLTYSRRDERVDPWERGKEKGREIEEEGREREGGRMK